MRAIYWTSVIVVAAIASLFAASNRAVVTLGLWPSPYLAQAPLYLVVLAALVVGIAIGAAAAWIRGRHRRRQLREYRRRNEALARELAATQSQLATPPLPAGRSALPMTR